MRSTGKYKAFFNRGNCLRRLGRLEDSVADLRSAVELEPNNASAHNNLALSLMENGHLSSALEELNIAVSLGCALPTVVDPFLESRYKQSPAIHNYEIIVDFVTTGVSCHIGLF